jgi:hypothetical protein
MQVVSFLKDKTETEARAARNSADVARLNEVIALFTRFMKSAAGKSISNFHIFPILQRLFSNLGSLCALRHSAALPECFHRLRSSADHPTAILCPTRRPGWSPSPFPPPDGGPTPCVPRASARGCGIICRLSADGEDDCPSGDGSEAGGPNGINATIPTEPTASGQ